MIYNLPLAFVHDKKVLSENKVAITKNKIYIRFLLNFIRLDIVGGHNSVLET